MFVFPAVNILIPSFDGRASFIAYPTLDDAFYITFLYLEIRPALPDGLILLNTQINGPDFIAIALRGGRAEFWYDLGQGAVSIVSTVSLSLNEWHSIQVSRTGRNGRVVVDDALPVSGSSPGYFSLLQISSDLYLGGSPSLSSLPKQLQSLNSFNGCIRELRTTQLTSSLVNLISDASASQGIMECQILDICNSSTCFNGGTCINTIESFVCHCLPGFTGVQCEIDLCVVSNPCQNNGVCFVDGMDLLQCNCSAPFTGQTCSNSESLIC